jgi:oxygen-independent coproporphyrinogen III oxidase
MQVSDYLLKKYNQPVPRYTSYPPANHFSDDFSENDYNQLLKQSNKRNPENISIYLHIPYCKKLCYYCGCNMCMLTNTQEVKAYIDALKKEIKLTAAQIDKKRKVSQIHYGGGTPNSIPAEYLQEINELLFSEFQFIENPEIAIETNPAYLDEKYIAALKKAKFNRFSLGIQDFDKKVLDAVNREHTVIPVPELMEMLKDGDPNIHINLDFIYGLPGQTVKSFTQTMEKAAEMRPDRLVTFSYAHVPWVKPHQKVLEKKGLPGPAEKMEMFLTAREQLQKSGYLPVGLDHFVLPEDELGQALSDKMLHRNFQGYCTRRTTGQVYAFGVTSISQLADGFKQNTKDIKEYIASINENKIPVIKGLQLNDEEKIVGEVLNEFMCNKQIYWAETAKRLGISEEKLKSTISINIEELKTFEADGLMEYKPEGLSINETGELFIRNIAASLDPAYNPASKQYSKSV